MIEYFPGSYWLNLNFCNALACGASIGDVDQASGAARALLAEGLPETDERVRAALIEGWLSVGARLAGEAAADHATARPLSAGQKLLRAAAHLMIALWMLPPGDQRKRTTFMAMRQAFLDGVRGTDGAVAAVLVPWEGGALDGVLVPALGSPGKPAPVAIHFNGTHSTLEWPYLSGFARELARRGVASLLLDHPGSGSARYRRGLMLRPDTETVARAALAFLERCDGIDPRRVAAMGGSLGGYHAPRAASLEPRIRACLCWGALYELPDWIVAVARGNGDRGPLHDPALTADLRQLFGVADGEDPAAKIRAYSLSGVIDRFSGVLAVAHGRNDRQVPFAQAERLVGEAVNAERRELIAFGPETGGDQHCSLDNLPAAREALCDRAAEALLG